MSVPAAKSPDTVTVATFNIQVFGEDKLRDEKAMTILADTVRNFDVIAIQEIRALNQGVLPQFIDRINAAGRLSDMTLGIECLLTDDPARGEELARTLDGINRDRREIEGDMREQAMAIAEALFEEGEEPPPAICVFDPDFHEGVVGIVASRIKDKLHRPTFVFAASQAPGMIRGPRSFMIKFVQSPGLADG